MSNSKLVDYTYWSPNCGNYRNGKFLGAKRTAKIDTITIHHMAGNLSIETCGAVFAKVTRQASSNYGVGSDGRIGQYVDESNRAWTTSSPENDNRAVTIEVANDEIGGEWHVSDKAYKSLIKLVADICLRNGIKRLNYTGDKSGNLTMHCWFAATACPGPYLKSKFPEIAKEVNKKLAEAEKDQEKEKYFVQCGAFKKKANAVLKVKELKAAGFNAFTKLENDRMYHVQCGAYSLLKNAKAMVAKLADAGFTAIIKQY